MRSTRTSFLWHIGLGLDAGNAEETVSDKVPKQTCDECKKNLNR